MKKYYVNKRKLFLEKIMHENCLWKLKVVKIETEKS